MAAFRAQLLTVALIALLGASWCYDTPLLMWSGENYFTGKNVQIESTVSVSDYTSILAKSARLGSQNLPQNLEFAFSTTQKTPEVLVIYLESMLRTDQASTYRDSLAQLRKEVSNSKSSVVIPFVDIQQPKSNAVPSAVVEVAKSLASQVVFIGSSGSKLATYIAQELTSTTFLSSYDQLKRDNAIFSNGRTDIIVVEFTQSSASMAEKLSSDDVVVSALQDLIEDATDGNYVSIFGAVDVAMPVVQTKFPISVEHVHVFGRDDTHEKNPPEWWAYFPAWFWSGFIWMVIFIFITLVAIISLCTMQTPTTWLSDRKKHD